MIGLNFRQAASALPPKSLRQNANGAGNKRPLPSAPRLQPSLSNHTCASSPALPLARARRDIACHSAGNSVFRSLPTPNKRSGKAARPRTKLRRSQPGRGCLAAGRGPSSVPVRGRAGRGRGNRAALKWLPASSCREGDCCPGGPRRPAELPPPCSGRGARIWGTYQGRGEEAGTPSFNSAKVSSAPHCSARRVRPGIAMATSPSPAFSLLNS